MWSRPSNTKDLQECTVIPGVSQHGRADRVQLEPLLGMTRITVATVRKLYLTCHVTATSKPVAYWVEGVLNTNVKATIPRFRYLAIHQTK